jgi:hypothetical protein
MEIALRQFVLTINLAKLPIQIPQILHLLVVENKTIPTPKMPGELV